MEGETNLDVNALYAEAESAGRVGLARKAQLVDARAAAEGEVVVTYIAGEGKESQSKPAAPGDMVVRNRSAATGNEEYLVEAEVFRERYEGPLGPAEAGGWQAYRPRGADMHFVVFRDADCPFTFIAPWGEEQTARPGDVLIRNPAKPEDTYRVAKAAFEGTYQIIKPPPAET